MRLRLVGCALGLARESRRRMLFCLIYCCPYSTPRMHAPLLIFAPHSICTLHVYYAIEHIVVLLALLYVYVSLSLPRLRISRLVYVTVKYVSSE